jgi:ribosomal protein L37E
MSRPRGTPSGVEHYGDRIEYDCSRCGDRVVAVGLDGTPWKCAACGAIDRRVESYVDEIRSVEARAARQRDRATDGGESR